jgi:hypothetical protein
MKIMGITTSSPVSSYLGYIIGLSPSLQSTLNEEYKKISLSHNNSIVKNIQGIFTNQTLLIDDKVINDELHLCEDPLFPFDELIGFVSHDSFESIFDNFCSRYIKQSQTSNIYNLERERYYFVVTQDVMAGSELLLRHDIQYWLVEVLKHLSITHYPIWCRIASKYAKRDLEALIQSTQVRYRFFTM